MGIATRLRSRTKLARKRGAGWVGLLDIVRLLPTSDGRSRLWTRFVHRRDVHQTSTSTFPDRYPELFDLAAVMMPRAERILSFGCSTGEELLSLRRRFPQAKIIGTDINPRARRLASLKTARDSGISVVPPGGVRGSFDLVFALAVLQRQPHWIAEADIRNLAAHYPFARFEAAVAALIERLHPGGLLFVFHAHYRVEDCAAMRLLEPVHTAPILTGPLFGPSGDRLEPGTASAIFRRPV